MKKHLLFFSTVIAMVACNNQKATPAEDAATIAKPAVALAYKASYSSSFEIGKPEYAAIILKEEWKAWEENKMDNMKSWMADTIVAVFSDNTTIKGADSLAAIMKKYRAMFPSVIDTINAVIPVYSTDKKEDWVLVWATEIVTKTNGSKDTMAWMETWRFNKDGKADLLLQFDRAKRKQ